jgi:hypothetical protein
MRKLAEEGKPLPTIGDANTKTVQKPTAAATVAFAAPLVTGKGSQDLIATTDKKARVDELEKKMGIESQQPSDTLIKKPNDPKKPNAATTIVAESNQLRDPFTSTVINPVPKLETLLEKPKEPPKVRAAVVVKTSGKSIIVVPPDIKEAQGTIISGTIEVAGTIYAIVKAPSETSARYVTVGAMLANRVRVESINTDAEPPIVTLRQNGIKVFRAVGEPEVGVVDITKTPTTPQITTSPSATNSPSAIDSPAPMPFLFPTN